MSSQLKLRRGSTVSHAGFTGADGEVTFDTDTNALVTHDGATAGGFPHTKVADLAAPSGTSLVGYMPPGAGAVPITLEKQLQKTIFITNNGAIGSGADETILAQAALNSGALKVIIPAGMTLGVSSLTMAAGQTLVIDGVLKKLSGASPVITSNTNCKITGTGEIDGNSIADADAIFATGQSSVTVQGLHIHHVGGKAVNLHHTPKSTVIGNKIENITNQAIELTFSDNSIVSNNYIDTAMHGIQFWGGDSALYPGTYIYDISITGNVIKNVIGGIWGSQGQRVSVVGNTVTGCLDVGIDFEGSRYCVANGNTLSKCDNGALALFYASSHCNFVGNVIKIDSAVGNKFGIWLTSHAHIANIFDSNVINVDVSGGIAIYADEGGTFNTFSKNNIYCGVGASFFRLFKQSKATVKDNLFTDCRLLLDGSIATHASGNTFHRKSTTNATSATEAAIIISWASPTWNALENTVTNNIIRDWDFSITDDCWGDSLSLNDCSYNRVSGVMSHRGTSEWYGRMVSNVLFSNPNLPATVVSF